MTVTPAYQAALDYLYSFVDFSLTHQQNLAPENFNLGRMRALMISLGNPQDTYKTIHIAGTKGKGSVSAFCESALREAGLKTGLYTSPHLKDFEERIQVHGAPIPQEHFVELVEEIKPHVAAIPRLTTFEISTALAFWYFARQSIDLAVIEVGLGGRLDATNIINPLVSVITSISKDHTYVLGDTLAEIAGEKGGIIKPGVPVVVSPQREEARSAIHQIATDKNCPIVQVGRDIKFSIKARDLEGQIVSIWPSAGSGQNPVLLKIPLLGDHQAENAAVAYTTLQIIKEQGNTFNERSIQQGFTQTNWPGRFEILQSDPYVIVDCAHNPYSARALRNTMDLYLPDLPIILIVGFSADKDISAMMETWLPRTTQVIATQSGHPRAMPPDELADLITALGDIPVTAAPNANSALNEALRVAANESIILAVGSVFLAASARIAWVEQHQMDGIS